MKYLSLLLIKSKDVIDLKVLYFVFRTYLPSQVSRVVGLWRESLSKVSEKAGQSLADPKEYDNLFPGLSDALKTEQYLLPERSNLLPASAYVNIPVSVINNYFFIT